MKEILILVISAGIFFLYLWWSMRKSLTKKSYSEIFLEMTVALFCLGLVEISVSAFESM